MRAVSRGEARGLTLRLADTSREPRASDALERTRAPAT